MVNKHANALLVPFNKAPLRNDKHNVNIFEVKKIFFEKKQTKAKFYLFKNLQNE